MKCFLVILFCFALRPLHAQSFAFTSESMRIKHDQELVDSVINKSLKYSLDRSTEKEWRKAFWAMELMLYKTLFIKDKLASAWGKVDSLSEDFQKALLEVTYTLYPTEFAQPISKLLNATSSPAVFVRSAEYLHRAKGSKYGKVIRSIIQTKFPQSDYIGISLLEQRLVQHKSLLPSLKDLFDTRFLPGETVLYSLQRKNRNYPGLIVIRKPSGTFVKDNDVLFFHVPQLARAITNYPYYITNGNTPQGIFRWNGFDSSTNSYIGPTTNLQMVMPYEATPEVFFNSAATNVTWNKELYAHLLPDAWKGYDGIYESFEAGAIGRTEVIMHGTAINPDYYKGQVYYPNTPSMGCLCSYEAWDANGKLAHSNQKGIVEALKASGATRGYVVVINLDDRQAPVTIEEIKKLLR